jgi:hypothetical protein
MKKAITCLGTTLLTSDQQARVRAAPGARSAWYFQIFPILKKIVPNIET